MKTSMVGEKKPPLARRRYLVAGSIGMLFSGIIYAWSILKVPIMDAFGWTASQMAFNYTLTIYFFCLGSVLGGILVNRISVKILLSAAGLLVSAGFMLVSQLSGDSVLGFYLSYGVLIGLGIGIAYNTLISVTSLWFPDQKGICSGTLMMCFGWSAMILGQTASVLFSSAPADWRGTFRLFGVLALLVMLFCAGVLRKPSSAVVFPPPIQRRKRMPELSAGRDYSTREVLCRPTFWLFYVYGILGTTVGSVVISCARDLALTIGAEIPFATALVGVLSICNGMGRILCGFVFDLYGRKRTMLAISILTMSAPTLMLVAILRYSLPLGVLAFCLTGLAYGCYPTISASVIAAFYGSKNFSIHYSISNTKLLVSSFAATLTTMLLVHTGSYVAPFVMLLSFSVLALFFNFMIRHP